MTQNKGNRPQRPATPVKQPHFGGITQNNTEYADQQTEHTAYNTPQRNNENWHIQQLPPITRRLRRRHRETQ
eukprot:12922507-Prorocentrum_lima.AAC.1